MSSHLLLDELRRVPVFRIRVEGHEVGHRQRGVAIHLRVGLAKLHLNLSPNLHEQKYASNSNEEQKVRVLNKRRVRERVRACGRVCVTFLELAPTAPNG